MSTNFRFFALPYLPLKQVLDHFGSQEILYFSLCSQKSKKLAVSYKGPSKNVQLELCFGNFDCLEDDFSSLLHVRQLSELPKDRVLDTVKIGRFSGIPVEKISIPGEKMCLKTYWEDRIIGMTVIGDYAREVFNRDIYEVMLGDEHAENDHRKVVDWIRKSQRSIENFYCNFTPKVDEDIDYLLENCKYNRMLSLFVKPSDAYCPASMPNFNQDILYLDPCFWIKQHHLLAMNATCIALHKSKFTHFDLNIFLKHWRNGGCFQLKELIVTCEVSIDYDILLDGVEFTEMDEDMQRDYVNDEKHHQTIEYGFDIKRPVDDVTATIVDVGVDFKEFWMIVWPDFAGNTY
ncbi:hypothetical protein CRE_05257 [Caenorhabditis remanei]|uniref:Sdz-33 F-box domain-containing protein n=1 Tax=Caenorhabditis remanei TaxID=31234 RepID=E3NIE3_CAERE|nr:hypothetical protein CRE_05257 [Caenorhabditis remanei]